jgi:hypothetical protein
MLISHINESPEKIDRNIRHRKRGLRQGIALSTVLFDIVLEKVVGNVQSSPNGTICNRTRLYVAYADDLLIFGRSVRATQEVVTQLIEAAITTGLMTNDSKTKYMEIKKI